MNKYFITPLGRAYLALKKPGINAFCLECKAAFLYTSIATEHAGESDHHVEFKYAN